MMFGFLKQKLNDFTNKLKAKAGEEKKEETKNEKVPPIETAKPAEIITPEKPATHAETNPAASEKKETTPAKDAKPADETPAKPQKPEEKEKQEPKKEEKKGLLSKIFGIGKEKKPQEQKKETQKQPEKKEEKKKTKEETAEELERKMFEKIEAELKSEGASGKAPEHKEEEIPITHEKAAAQIIPQLEEVKKETQKTTVTEKAVIEEKKIETPKKVSELQEEIIQDTIDEDAAEEEPQIEQVIEREKPRDIKIATMEEDKRELKAKVGVTGKIKGFLFGGVEISEKEINDLLEELELSLIESDVEQDAALELVKQIRTRLIGQKTSSKNLDEYIKEQIKEILAEMMKTPQIDLLQKALEKKKEGKPLKILMLGPNGAGKTTSIAKLVHYFKKHKLSSILAAGDTFRAGAIDQIEEHALRLGVRVIKQQYGADPAAVAFDAVKAAEAGKIDVIIIDSAGRQETNKNLMEELRKIERVAKPDVKIYVGEAYAGQTLLEQVAEFEEMIGIDGFILTKIDTDAKGGTAISLTYKTKKPIIFVGTGQGYDDFKEFTPNFVLERII